MNLFRTRTRVFGVVAALLVVAASCGADAEVAEVDGGDSLTQADLLADPEESGDAASVGEEALSEAALAELLGGPPEGTVDKLEAAQTINSWVINQLFYAELAARGVELTDADLSTARATLEETALVDPSVPDLDSALGAEIIRSQALPDLVVYYLLDVAQIEPAWPVQMCSSHILLETEQDALAAIARLDEGEEFATLAMELSTGPSGPTGGDLGCVDPASFVPEFTEGAALVDAPGISAPVESDFGWHVIEVRSFDATPSDDQNAIRTAVFSTPEFLTFQEAAIARKVAIDARYGTWDADSLRVVPAAG